MVDAQVFRWFCKEQKIIPKIREMYYEINPYISKYSVEEGLTSENISFNEYIHNIINLNGFLSSFDALLSYYKRAKYKKIGNFVEYEICAKKIDNDFRAVRKKWKYFVNNCIMIDESTLKVGDVVSIKSFGGLQGFMIDIIDICNSRLIGRRYRDGNLETLSWTTSLFSTIDKNGTINGIKFYIKRNGKEYHGSN